MNVYIDSFAKKINSYYWHLSYTIYTQYCIYYHNYCIMITDYFKLNDLGFMYCVVVQGCYFGIAVDSRDLENKLNNLIEYLEHLDEFNLMQTKLLKF